MMGVKNYVMEDTSNLLLSPRGNRNTSLKIIRFSILKRLTFEQLQE